MTDIKAVAVEPKNLLNPHNHALILLDHQSQMAFNVKSIDIGSLRSNAAILAETGKAFGVPTIVSTISRSDFAGPVFPEITKVFPNTKEYINRTTSDAIEDQNFVNAINATGKKRIVIAGLWTSVCLNGPVQGLLEQGFEVYVVADASGDMSHEAHVMAMHRMIQSGAVPITSTAYLLELQRDWERKETYPATMEISQAHAGAFGIGIQYAYDMVHGNRGIE
ncbi:hydrolase [Pantoea sp. ICBG 1758]|uniref:hydrolase n=1 Tax=Pantoea sp. ICBG 1758 TaxID=2071682 RepID=UPI000CE314F9|nr:hydrolase [Pantoea sp. ICBG 1758]PPC63876.1 hydrolase [Pantoea sp. ICBG 1758]